MWCVILSKDKQSVQFYMMGNDVMEVYDKSKSIGRSLFQTDKFDVGVYEERDARWRATISNTARPQNYISFGLDYGSVEDAYRKVNEIKNIIFGGVKTEIEVIEIRHVPRTLVENKTRTKGGVNDI